LTEFINVAHAQGVYSGKPIRAISNPWKITVQRKRYCVCKCIHQTFYVSDLFCNTKCYVYYNGVRPFQLNGRSYIRVGYGVCIKYKDCDGTKKNVTREGSVLFFEPTKPYSGNYTVHIPNLPCFKICGKTITADFSIVLHD